jgi:hypothetical protein
MVKAVAGLRSEKEAYVDVFDPITGDTLATKAFTYRNSAWNLREFVKRTLKNKGGKYVR